MARMHSRRKGKAGSTKPATKSIPSWVRYTASEVELLIMKLAKEDKTPSQIGMILRDVYGIPDVRTLTNKKIVEILDEKNLGQKLPEDLLALITKAVSIRKHIGQNKQDMTAHRGLLLTESKIKRLVKYYKNTGKLPETWKYDPEQAKIYTD